MTDDPAPDAAATIEDQARACYLGLGSEDLDEDVVYIAGYVTGHAAGATELDAARARVGAMLTALKVDPSTSDPVSAALFVRQTADAFAARVAELEAELADLRRARDAALDLR